MLVDYLLAIKGASSFNLYLHPWLGRLVVGGSSRFVSTEFHPAGDSPGCPAQWSSGQRPDLNLEFLWKFVTSRMLIKKVSGRAGLICNIVVAL